MFSTEICHSSSLQPTAPQPRPMIFFRRGCQDITRRGSRRSAKVLEHFVRQINGEARGSVFAIGHRFHGQVQGQRDRKAHCYPSDAPICWRGFGFQCRDRSDRGPDCWAGCSDCIIHIPISLQQDAQRRKPRAAQHALRALHADFSARRPRHIKDRARTFELRRSARSRECERITRCRVSGEWRLVLSWRDCVPAPTLRWEKPHQTRSALSFRSSGIFLFKNQRANSTSCIPPRRLFSQLTPGGVNRLD